MAVKNIKGLTDAEVKASRDKYGDNSIPVQEGQTFIKKFLSSFGDPIIRILIGALVINIVFMLKDFNLFETIGIVIAILTSTLVSTISEYGSEKAFEKLRLESENIKCRVIRNAKMTELPEKELVCGDIVLISAGERIPADGKIIEGALKLDMSAINGESGEVKKYSLGDNTYGSKTDSPDVLLRGSVVTGGEGIMCVEAVGANTAYGKLAGELQESTRTGPLNVKLTKLAKQISRIGYIAAVIVAVGYIFNVIVIDSGFSGPLILEKLRDVRSLLETVIHALTLAVTIIIVAVPEGLPMMVTVVLSANMKKMLADNILVKKLVGIETAGSMNILFCDKTGTLTTGQQCVESVIDGFGNFYYGTDDLKKSTEIYRLTLLNAALNTESKVSDGKIIGGNITDRALAGFFGADKLDYSADILSKIPFDSAKKFSSVTVKEDGRKRVFIKGAPEYLLPCVKYVMTSGGKPSEAFDKTKLLGTVRELTENSKRVIAIVESDEIPKNVRNGNYTLICLVSIRDRIRNDAKISVEKLKTAGIQVVMLTGDNKETAESIAKECGIMGKFCEGIVITSEELAKLDDNAVALMLPSLSVVARALPSDKTRLVRISQSMGLVAGMTGDGVNDAPALKIADVGFAMGSGTEVAKEAGDIVLLDNNLSYIVKTVIYGRTIFKSIRKFIIFQLTMNMCAVGISLIGPYIGVDTPVTVIQMLWINIIMDTLGGLAFAGEPPLENCLKEKPKKREESIITKYMAGQIAFGAFVTISICLFFLTNGNIKRFFGYSQNPIYFMSAFFCLFIFLGIANCFIARSARINILSQIGKNKPFVYIMILVTVIQLTMVYFGGSTFRAAPLSFIQLLFLLSVAVLTVLIEIVRRIVLRITGKSKIEI